uniref:Uncharacterized protein n=1 Tax=Romanomermis culicivorax TaxID=13658 RepID=A0A915JFC2_ROMCU
MDAVILHEKLSRFALCIKKSVPTETGRTVPAEKNPSGMYKKPCILCAFSYRMSTSGEAELIIIGIQISQQKLENFTKITNGAAVHSDDEKPKISIYARARKGRCCRGNLHGAFLANECSTPGIFKHSP